MFLYKKYFILLFFFFYIFFFFFFCSRLSPLYEFNSWTDVNVYFTIGKGLMNGLVVYKDLFDHKGPLIFLIYGCGYLISNTSFLGVFLIEVCLFSIAIYYVYLIIKMFSSDVVALSLSIIFPLFYLFYSSQGGSAEDFILVAEIISLYYFLKYFTTNTIDHSRKFMFIHGFMIGFTFFIKLNLILYWFFPLLLIFILLVYNKFYVSFFQNLLFLLLGFLSIAFPVFLYFVINDSLNSFWEAYIDFNLLYNSQHVDSSFWGRIVSNFSEFKFRDLVFLSFCLFGFIIIFSCGLFYKKFGLVVLFLSFIFQLIITFSGPFLMLYYLLSSLVFVVLGLVSLAVILNKYTFISNLKVLPFVFGFLFLLLATVRTNFWGYSIENLISNNYPESEISLFSREIQKKDNPSLLCAGFDPTLTIFTTCNIVPNVRYFFLPNIKIEHYPEICNAQIEYILNKEVDFLILDDRFRYYDYYIEAVNKNYKIRSSFLGSLGYYIHLYEKK